MKNTGIRLRARAPITSLVLMREPSRLLRRSMYSLTPRRTSMKPRVTVNRKIRVETAQKMKVCWGSFGRKSPKSNEPCQTTNVAEIISTTSAAPYRRRFFMVGCAYCRLYRGAVTAVIPGKQKGGPEGPPGELLELRAVRKQNAAQAAGCAGCSRSSR